MVWIAYPFLLGLYAVSLYLVYMMSQMRSTAEALVMLGSAIILHIFLIWVVLNA